MSTQERYLIIGGSGFLGSYVAEALLARGEKNVAVYDITMPVEGDVLDGVTYFQGDILNEEYLLEVLQKQSVTTAFHTVSPLHEMKLELHLRVNVEGTRSVVSACRKAKISSLIYTSSTGAVWTGQVCSGAKEEDLPLATTWIFDNYGYTKALAEEIVTKANDPNGMRTAAIRPCGMLGPRDRQAMWRIALAYQNGQHKYRIGDAKCLVDITYVGNVADAHILAADKISFSSPDRDKISGEAFFITNGKPRAYRGYSEVLWKLLGDDGKGQTQIPVFIGWMFAVVGEFTWWLTGNQPLFDMYTYRVVTTEQWYSCEKARKLLGYEPRVSYEEGCARSVEWWNQKGAKQYAAKLKR